MPVALFAGSSSVSTWGAVEWSMEAPEANDLRWQRQDVQGVIEATVVNTQRAFQTVTSVVHRDEKSQRNQMLAPIRIWMDGPDLPPAKGWIDAVSRARGGNISVGVWINETQISKRLEGYEVPLSLLAWMNSSERRQLANGIIQARCTTASVLDWINQFLGRPWMLGPRKKKQPHINKILEEAVTTICDNGGLAMIEPEDPKQARAGDRKVFTLYFREPPAYLPVFRLPAS
jgi:hypothetical protein